MEMGVRYLTRSLHRADRSRLVLLGHDERLVRGGRGSCRTQNRSETASRLGQDYWKNHPAHMSFPRKFVFQEVGYNLD